MNRGRPTPVLRPGRRSRVAIAGLAAAALACTRAEPMDPVVDTVEPPEVTYTGDAIPVAVLGRFEAVVKVDLDRGGDATIDDRFEVKLGTEAAASVRYRSERRLDLDLPPSLLPGLWTVEVLDPKGRRATREGALTVRAPDGPVVRKVAPDRGPIDGEVVLTVDGVGFLRGAKVVVGPATLAPTEGSATRLVATLPAGLEPGAHGVRVINPDGQAFTVQDGYKAIGPPVRFPIAVPAGGAIAGVAFDVTITARDAAGQVSEYFAGTAQLSDRTQTIAPAETGSFSAGIRVQRVTITRAGRDNAITARAGAAQGVSDPFEVRPGPAASLSLTPDKSDYEAGDAAAVTARAQDAFQNRVPLDDTVFDAQASGQGTLQRGAGPRFNYVDGEARLSYVSRAAETATIAAQYSGSDPQTAQASLTFRPAAPRAITLASSSPSPVVGDTVTLSASLFDAFGNPVAAQRASDVILGPSGTAACSGRASPPTPSDLKTPCYGPARLVAGRVEFDLTTSVVQGTFDAAADADTGDCAAQPRPAGCQARLAVTTRNAPLDQFDVAVPVSTPPNPPWRAVAGDPFAVGLTALDRWGNVVRDFSAAAAICDDTGSLNKSVTRAFFQGERFETVFVRKVPASGSTRIRVNSGASCTDPSGRAGASAAFGVDPADPATFAFGAIGTQNAGQAFPVSLTVLDVYGNVATVYAGRASLSDTTGTVSPKTSAAFASGASTTQVTLVRASTSVNLLAEDGPVRGVSAAFEVKPGPPVSLVFATPVRSTSPSVATAPIRIELRDAQGNLAPAAGPIAVNVTSDSATGQMALSGSTAYTSPLGATIATGQTGFDFTFRDSTGGSHVVSATASGFPTASQNVIVGGAGQPARVKFVVAPSGAVPAGSPQGLTVEVQDSGGAKANIPTQGVQIDFATTSPRGGFATSAGGPYAATLSVLANPADSRASVFHRDTLAASPGPTVSAGGTNLQFNVTLSPDQVTFPVSPGPLAGFEVARTGTGNVVAGDPVPFAITAQDAYGNTVTGFTGPVALSANPADSAMAPTSAAFVAADGGRKTVSLQFTRAQTTSLTASDGASPPHTGASAPFAVHAAGLSSYRISTPPSPQTAGAAFPLTVEALDVYGNPVESSTSVTLGVSGVPAGSWTPTTSGAFTGSATLTVVITKAAVGVALTATDGTFSATSSAFDVKPGPFDRFTITNTASPQVAGTTFTVTVRALDLYGNETTESHSVAIAAAGLSSGQYTPASSGAFLGRKDVAVTITQAVTGTRLTVTEGSASASQTATFDVVAGPVDHYALQVPSCVAPNLDFNFTVQARDAWNNVAASFTGRVNFSVSQGTWSPAQSASFIAGAATVTGRIRDVIPPVSVTLTAANAANTAHTGTATLNVQAVCL